MFINKIPFFMTVSRHIKFGTAEMLQNQQSKTMLAAIKQVKGIYMKRGFRLNVLLMDGQFEVLRGDLAEMQITLNTASNNEHVPEIERYIRTTKERTRCVYNTLPFKRLPARMIIEMVYYSTFWLNSFPADDGISDTLSPRALVVGSQIDYAKHCKLEFGTYVQTHEEHDNSMATRTTGAIALRPTGNEQGGYYFMSLTTGRVLNRNHWTALPMPGEVIDRVHALARRTSAGAPGLAFLDRDGNPLVDPDDDDSDDESYRPSDNDEDDDDDDDNVYDPDGHDAPIAGVYQNGNEAEVEAGLGAGLGAKDNYAEQVEAGLDAGLGAEDNYAEQVEIAAELQDDTDDLPLDQEMDNKYGPRTGEYELRPRRPRDYSHLHTTLEGTVMTQLNMKKGIQIFGEAGVDAVLKELQQLHDRKVLEPKSASCLSSDEKKAALQYLMFKKKKEWQYQGTGMCRRQEAAVIHQ
jgi:hypothetical protein